LTKQTTSLSLSKPEITDKIVDTITQLASNFDVIDSSLAEKVSHGDIVLSVKDYGAKGDGISDDTSAIQSCFNVAIANGKDIMFPFGKYLVTSPITITAGAIGDKIKHPRIYGTSYNAQVAMASNVYYGGDKDNATTIIGKNIGANRAVIELLGSSIEQAYQGTIEHIRIDCTDNSNNAKSFCLKVGTGSEFRALKVALVGKNALLTKSGSGNGSGGGGTGVYAFVCSKFEQCRFTAIGDGYSFRDADSENLAYNTGKADNIIFDTCYFYGTAWADVYNGRFLNCMFQVYPNRGNISYGTALDNVTVDYSTGLLITAGNVVVDNCYFEDYRNAIIVQTVRTFLHVKVENTFFNSFSNELIGGVHPSANSAIQCLTNPIQTTITANSLIIDNCNVYETDDHLFTDSIFKNLNANVFRVTNTNIYGRSVLVDIQDRITDTASFSRTIHNNQGYDAMRLKELNFDLTVTGSTTNATLKDTDISAYKFDKSCCLNYVEIYVNKKTVASTEFFVGFTNSNGNSRFISFSDLLANKVMESTNGFIARIYMIPKGSPIDISDKRYMFKKGETLTVQFYSGNFNTGDNSTVMKVKSFIEY
jgi:hypothetical protein